MTQKPYRRDKLAGPAHRSVLKKFLGSDGAKPKRKVYEERVRPVSDRSDAYSRLSPCPSVR